MNLPMAIGMEMFKKVKEKELERLLWEEWCALQPYCEETFPAFKHKRMNPTSEQVKKYNDSVKQSQKKKLTKEEVFDRVAKIRGKAGE
ncbi:hypothetical protein ABE244_04150 [Bacillus toyonensis]|uniref:hypothetical protein n=1 Tax=Bacillus toyonensis TaxID=155322 RepID=UPI003D222337